MGQEDLVKQVEELKGEIQLLKDRPPMACLGCEEHNEELSDELDTLKAWRADIHEARHKLAWASYVEAWFEAANIQVDDWVKYVMDLKSYPRYDEMKTKFEKWWNSHKHFA